ncbi:MAG: tRNA lysidine(34) synthetase TilS [Acidobacteriota bacterium]
MHKFVRSLITEWRKLDLPFTDETIVVAVSGGADSMSLLLATHDLQKRKKFIHRVVVAHFNHKLRGTESDLDERFVQKQAADLGFEFVFGTASLSKKGNLEQAARNARYEFLARIGREKDALAVLVAHTQNDQAETLLFNLIRGSGPDGLAGMRQVRKLEDDILLVRPLLSWASRTDTEAFCRDNEVLFRSDPMNEDEKYRRVQIRRDIIPRLAEINPKIVETLARTADLMHRSSGDITLSGEDGDRGTLIIKDLNALKRADLYSTLRAWLRTKRGSLRSLQLKHVEAIERLILSRKSGNTVELPGGGRIVKHGGALRFTNIKVEK